MSIILESLSENPQESIPSACHEWTETLAASVADREGDIHERFVDAQNRSIEEKAELIVRAKYNRRTEVKDDEHSYLWKELESSLCMGERSVQTPHSGNTNPHGTACDLRDCIFNVAAFGICSEDRLHEAVKVFLVPPIRDLPIPEAKNIDAGKSNFRASGFNAKQRALVGASRDIASKYPVVFRYDILNLKDHIRKRTAPILRHSAMTFQRIWKLRYGAMIMEIFGEDRRQIGQVSLIPNLTKPDLLIDMLHFRFGHLTQPPRCIPARERIP